MTDNKKPKHKPQSFRRMKDDITRIDEKTFYVKSSDPEKEPYMVFNSANKGLICDCMAFVMNIEDNGNTKECKHIKRVISSYFTK